MNLFIMKNKQKILPIDNDDYYLNICCYIPDGTNYYLYSYSITKNGLIYDSHNGKLTTQNMRLYDILYNLLVDALKMALKKNIINVIIQNDRTQIITVLQSLNGEKIKELLGKFNSVKWSQDNSVDVSKTYALCNKLY